MKDAFANTLNELSGMPPMSECFNYGMTWGCDEDCPVLARGECEHQETENKHLWDKIKTNKE